MRLYVQILLGISLWGRVEAQKTATAQVEFTFSDEVVFLDLEGPSSITLTFTAPTEAGNALAVPPVNSSLWLNLTSAVEASETREVTAQVTAGNLPDGVTLNLQVTGPSGAGGGARGSAVPVITLNNSAQTIISGIGGAYTGHGEHGFQLSYSASIQNYSQLKAGNTTFSVTFTLSDN